MKKIFYLFILVSTGVFSQEKATLDTIFANDLHNVTLFFPNPIRQGIVGAPNFTFSFNEDSLQYFGLLKAVPGKESSLLVLTADGQIYSYFLRYRADLPRLNYFIKEKESIGNEVPQVQLQDSAKVKGPVQVDQALGDSLARVSYLKNLSSYYLRNATGKLKSKKKDKLRLTVKELNYYRNEIFTVFEIENRSGIDFEIDFLNVYLTRGTKKRNASFQSIIKRPIYIHEFPEVVKDQQKRAFVYVLPKFTLGENEELKVEVREKRGNRLIRFSLKPSMP